MIDVSMPHPDPGVVPIDRRCGDRRIPAVGRWCLAWAGALLLMFTGPEASAADTAGDKRPGLRIAVAPFVGEETGQRVGEGEGEAAISELLSIRLVRLGVERLLAPGSFVALRSFDPTAAVVRAWAQQAAVDSIIVGRVVRLRPRAEAEQVEAVVRSGHSGAELFRHAVLVPARAGLGSALDQLAAAIVRDLGGDPLKEAAGSQIPTPPPVSAGGPAAPEGARPAAAKATTGPAGAPAKDGSGVKAGSGLQTRIGVAKFRSDAPIEIKADQAEISAEGDDRKLVFEGGVWVKQDNVIVTSQHLEAEYVDGESEPSRLLARGAVHVEQGNRAARCDQAEYLRATSQLTCRGHAELVQGCDVVRGEVIVLDLGADRARVEGAASIVINPKESTDPRCVRPGGAS
ncbi:hypothetical protein K2X89_04175 [Myxococcota bacterium]|nr:hypothetical protein [Myxococcota bacterium]